MNNDNNNNDINKRQANNKQLFVTDLPQYINDEGSGVTGSNKDNQNIKIQAYGFSANDAITIKFLTTDTNGKQPNENGYVTTHVQDGQSDLVQSGGNLSAQEAQGTEKTIALTSANLQKLTDGLYVIEVTIDGTTAEGYIMEVDTTDPTLATVAIASNNKDQGNIDQPTRAKVGDVITLSFTVADVNGIQDNIKEDSVSVTINGNSVASANISYDTQTAIWTAQHTVTSSDTERTVPFTIDFTDLAGNVGTRVDAVTNGGGSVTVDTSAPTLNSVSIAASHTDGDNEATHAKTGAVVTLTITPSEAIQQPTVTFTSGTGNAITTIPAGRITYDDTSAGDVGTEWTAAYTVDANDTNGAVSFTVNCKDLYGNDLATQVTEDSSMVTGTVTVDKSPPTLNSVSIAASHADGEATHAKSGAVVTLTIIPNEAIQQPTVTFKSTNPSDDTNFTSVSGNVTTGGRITYADTSQNTDGTKWTAAYTVADGDIEGPVTFSLDYKDLAGNAPSGGQVTTVTQGGGSVTVDRTAPTLSAVAIASDFKTDPNDDATAEPTRAKPGSTITLTITPANSEAIQQPVVEFTINDGTTTNTKSGDVANNGDITYNDVNSNGTEWTAAYTVANSGDVDGTVSFTIDYKDKAGNAGTQVTGVTDNSLVTVDTTAPTLTDVEIASDNNDNTLAKNDDTVTLTITPSEKIQKPVVVFTSSGNGSSTTIQGDVADNNGGNITYVDTSQNADGSGPWTASYDVATSDTNGDVSFTVDFKDLAGNPGTRVTGVTDSSSVTVDTTAPTLATGTSALTIAATHTDGNDATHAKSGAVVTLTIIPNEAIQQPTVTFKSTNPSDDTNFTSVSGNVTTGGRITYADTSQNTDGTKWTAEYTVADGDIDGPVTFTLDFNDKAGNALATTLDESDITNSSSVTVDKTAALALTGLSIAASHSDNSNDATHAKAGAVVTLTIIPQEPIREPAVVFQSNGQNVNNSTITYADTSQNTDGTKWTAEYTVAGNDAEGAVTFTLDYTDLAGNAPDSGQLNETDLTSGSVTVDRTAAKALSALTIASDNTDQGDVARPTRAKENDTVTLTITPDSEAIRQPTVVFTVGTGNAATTIAANRITYTDTSTSGNNGGPDGTGPWKAAFDVAAGENGAVTFTLDYTDLAGNAPSGGQVTTVTQGGGSVNVDTTAPELTTDTNLVGLTIASNNTVDTSKAKEGDTITLTIIPSEAIQQPTVVFTSGSNKDAMTNVSNGVVNITYDDTSDNDDGTKWIAQYTLVNGDTEGDITFTVSFKDLAGNDLASNITSVTDTSSVFYDKSVPSLASVAIASNNSNTTQAKQGDIITLTITPSEAIQQPTVVFTSDGAAMTNATNGTVNISYDDTSTGDVGTEWTASYTVAATDTEGDIAFTINFANKAGIDGNQVDETSNIVSGSVTIDMSPPTAQGVIGLSNDLANGKINNSNKDTQQTVTFKAFNYFGGARSTDMVPTYKVFKVDEAASTEAEITSNGTLTRNTDVNNAADFMKMTYTFTPSVVFEDGKKYKIKVKAYDLAGNELQVQTNTEISYDITAPELTALAIESDNTDQGGAAQPTRAKENDTVTLTITPDEAISQPTVVFTLTDGSNSTTISGNATNGGRITYTDTSDSTDGTKWTAAFDVAAGENGDVSFTLDYTDLVGNAGKADATYTANGQSVTYSDSNGQVTDVFDSSEVTVDTTAPTLTALTISSDNSNEDAQINTHAKLADIVTLTITPSEKIQQPTVVFTSSGNGSTTTIQGVDITYNDTSTSGPGGNPDGSGPWTAKYTVGQHVEGAVTFTLDYKDLAGNAGKASATYTANGQTVTYSDVNGQVTDVFDSSSVTVDRTTPKITSTAIKAGSDVANNSNIAKIGDVLKLVVTFSEAVIVPTTSKLTIEDTNDSTKQLELNLSAPHTDSSVNHENNTTLEYSLDIIETASKIVSGGDFVISSITNITDLAQNELDLTENDGAAQNPTLLNVLAVTALGLDSVRPTISHVTATLEKLTDGLQEAGSETHLRTGDEIDFTLTFSEDIALAASSGSDTLVGELNTDDASGNPTKVRFSTDNANANKLVATHTITSSENSDGTIQFNRLYLEANATLKDTDGNSIETSTPAGRSLNATTEYNINVSTTIGTTNNFSFTTGAPGADIVIDTTVPTSTLTLPPQVDINGDGSHIHLTNNSTPIIAGTTEGESNVALYILGSNVATDLLIINPYTATANANGQWQIYAQGHQFNEGVNYIGLVTTDLAGNVNSNEVHSFTVDTSKPAPPSITSSLVTNEPSTYVLTGFTEPHSELTINFSDTSLSTVTIAPTGTSNGSFSANIDISGVSDGNYPFTISSNAMDAAGNVSDATIGTLTKDTTALTAAIELYHLGDKVMSEKWLKEGDVVNIKLLFNKTISHASQDLVLKFMDDDTNTKTISKNLLIGKSEANVYYTIQASDLGSLKIHSIGSNTSTENPRDAAGNHFAQMVNETTDVKCDSRAISIGNAIINSTANTAGYYGINDTIEINLPTSYVHASNNAAGSNEITVEDGTYLQLSNGGKAMYNSTSGEFDYKLIEGDVNFESLEILYYIGEISHKSGVKASSTIGETLSLKGIANRPSVPVITSDVPILTNELPTISGTAGANAHKVLININGVDIEITPNASKQWTYTPPSLAEQAHSIKVRAIDVADNHSEYSIPRSLTYDATGPTITLAQLYRHTNIFYEVNFNDDDLQSASVTFSIGDDYSKTIEATKTEHSDGTSTWKARYTVDDSSVDGNLKYVINATDMAGNLTQSDVQDPIFPVDVTPSVITSVQFTESGSSIEAVITLDEQNNDILDSKVKLVDSGNNEYQMSHKAGTEYEFTFNNSSSTLAEGPLRYTIKPFYDDNLNATQRDVTDTGLVINYNVAPTFTKSTYERTVELKKYGITNMNGSVYATASDGNDDDVLTYRFASSSSARTKVVSTEDGSYSTQDGTYGTLSLDEDDGHLFYETNQEIASDLQYNETVTDPFQIEVSDGELTDTAIVVITLVGKMCNDQSSCNYGSLGPCATNDCLGSCNGSAQKSGKVCYKVVTV